MSDLRSRFEETETYANMVIFDLIFNYENNTYTHKNCMYMSDVIAINAAWMMFQELNK